MITFFQGALKMRITYRLAFFMFLVFTLVGCNGNHADSSTEVLQKNLEKWQEMKIQDYRIEVMVVNSIWHAQKNALTVINGSPVDAESTCSPAPMEFGECVIQTFDLHDFEVEGLFSKAQEVLKSDGAADIEVKYDPDYSFPVEISYDAPAIVDDDWSWRVISFTQITER